ncbi:GIY-YIG nuclease family protein [Olivibacter sp. SDN3]|uniref:exonuclease domain-containing protein n=1 Tax=Olivibacter sp. SDN3 TaxID=2764720 RepID=UPI00165103CC|nr:exonuclease domain-containing protein [Olivibacter sp. SDN3]QNL48632.1 GIY-YIG nuclease family protein [Olivibacter sp. SDN3]
MEYAIVDIETTGGYAAGNGITEIAIHIYDGMSTTFTYESLINPQMPIPLYITALTGIDDDMVRDAPSFAEIAEEVYSLLEGRVFVAHNVNFDYSFLKHQLATCGYQLTVPKLCTVRLSRRLYPGFLSYSLGKLCQQLQITIHERHRAAGDVKATTILFSKLLAKDKGEVQTMLRRASKEQVLPPHLPKENFDKLPTTPGVYYFRNQKGKVIYVGKAKNIKHRVAAHFSGQNPNPQRQNFIRDIHTVDFVSCGTELMSFLLEAAEIKKLWPENNRALKRFEPKFGLYSYEDQKGYQRLIIDKHKRFQQSLHSFGSISEGYNFLNKLVNAYRLCPKLCAIQRLPGSCLLYGNGACDGACIDEEAPELYNPKVVQALRDFEKLLPSFVLLDKGRNDDEQSCIWVEKGKFYGMGYIPYESDLNHPNLIKDHLERYASNDYMMQLIMNYATKHPEKTISL